MAKTYRVRMLAFGVPNEVREVEVAEPAIDMAILLDQIYRFGQNDFQPKNHCSVSMGDVIEIGDDLYLIKAVGFKKLTVEEYNQYTSLVQLDRPFSDLVRK